MKNVIKISIVLFLMILTSASFAQTFGIKTGFTLSDMVIKIDGENLGEEFKMKPGFHVGGTVDFGISDVFSIETGLTFITKGTRWKESESYMGEDYETSLNINLYYLDIPVTAKVSIPAGNTKIYLEAGPYLGIGLVGNTVTKMSYNGETEKEKETIEWGEDDFLKRLDYGLRFGAGVVVNSFLIGASYDLGLANISSYTDEGSKIQNRVLSFSVGYRFNRNK